MSLKHMSIIFVAIAVTVLSTNSQAKEFIVGDDSGWTNGFDYKTWAEGKEFMVGDKLVFKYPVGAHSVHKVNGTAFQNCIMPPATEALVTGNDAITLATPGRKWYVCGVAKHCEVGGQKLAITALSADESATPAPAPAPQASYSAEGVTMSKFPMLIAVLATLSLMVIA